jgi:peptidyl-prolyl cis-trans isomerase B (cyclophilin B)
MIKKLLALPVAIALTASGFTAISFTASNTATAAGVTCAATKATAHQAPKLALPTFAKTYKSVTITLQTNCGNITFDALGRLAPITVQNFIYLAKNGFYNNTLCHRMTTAGIYVLQCGDPTAQGAGGPGWTIPDENLPTKNPINGYPTGTLAMANTGQPHTGGSQFFLIYKGAPGALSPSYTVFGKITQGLPILLYIASKGTDNANGQGDGHPLQTVSINKITVVGA